MSEYMKTRSDTELLDFYEKNNGCFLQLGKHWYVRKAYGKPFRKCNNLREAIILGISLNTSESPTAPNPVIQLTKSLAPNEIKQRLHYYNLTLDKSAFQDVPDSQQISFMYPDVLTLGLTGEQRKQKLTELFGPLNEHWSQRLTELNKQ